MVKDWGFGPKGVNFGVPKWTPKWPKMAYFGPFWDPFLEAPFQLNMRFSHVFGPKVVKKGSQNGPQNDHFWGPLVTGSGPFWFDNEILGIEAPGHRGPQGPDLGLFWDPFWEAPFQVVPRSTHDLAQNRSILGPKMDPQIWPF